MTQERADYVWRKKAEAEIRSLYFGDLAARFAKRKQLVVALSFLLSAIGAIWLASSGSWVQSSLATGVAILNAYSIAVGLDIKALRMSRLHSAWNRLAYGYDQVWLHWYEDHSDAEFAVLLEKARDLSESATTEAPYDSEAIDRWTDHVASLYKPEAAV